MHTVLDLSEYGIGPLGGPMKLDWNFDPKPKVSAADRKTAVETLRDNWSKIVGTELVSITSPVRITGAKGRRLLVLTKINTKPPWGTWSRLDNSERRRSFTVFRAAINDAIAPLEIDHIDFVFDSRPTE